MTQPNKLDLSQSMEAKISADLAIKQELATIANNGNTVISNEIGLPYHSANVELSDLAPVSPINEATKKNKNRHGRRIAALSIAAGSLVAACGGNNDYEGPSADDIAGALAEMNEGERNDTTTTVTPEDSVRNGEEVVLDGSTLVISSDEDLASGAVYGDSNTEDFCGGGYDLDVNGEVSMLDMSYMMDFLNANPDVKEGAYDVLVTDSEWGFGEKAAKVITEKAFVNPDTVASIGDKTLGDDEKDALLVNKQFALTLTDDLVVVNGTCRFGGVEMPARDIPQLNLEAGTSVTGYMLTEEDFAEFADDAKNLDKFYTFKVKIKDSEGTEHTYDFVLTNTNGCDNPARVPQTPPTETTTPPVTTTPTETTTPPVTTVPVQTTTTTSSTTVPGRKAVVPSTEAPSTPVTAAPRSSTTLAPQPSTTTPDTIPAGVTTTIWDEVPTPSTIQEPDGPPVTATPPTTEAPGGTIAPSTTVTSGTIVSP